MTDDQIEAWVATAGAAARIEVLKAISRAGRRWFGYRAAARNSAKRAAIELEIVRKRWIARENLVLPKREPSKGEY